MAIQYQFNKTSLQGLEKDLKMRQRSLPTLQSKETALRLEVKRAKDEIKQLDEEVERRIKDYDQMITLGASLIRVLSTWTTYVCRLRKSRAYGYPYWMR